MQSNVPSEWTAPAVDTGLDLISCACAGAIIRADTLIGESEREPCTVCGQPVSRYALNVMEGYPVPYPTMFALRPLDDRTAERPPGARSFR